MRSSSSAPIEIGKLGLMTLRPGCYVYVGSAFGPGGLRARVLRHVAISGKRHWHIDYLRPYVDIVEVWWLAGRERREVQWVEGVFSLRGAHCQMLRFGASDSDCESHLLWFPRKPSTRTFLHRLRLQDPSHPDIPVSRVIA